MDTDHHVEQMFELDFGISTSSLCTGSRYVHSISPVLRPHPKQELHVLAYWPPVSLADDKDGTH